MLESKSSDRGTDRLARVLYAVAAGMAVATAVLALWSWQAGRRFRDQLVRAARVQAEVLARDFGEDFKFTSDSAVRTTLAPVVYGVRTWTPASAEALLSLARKSPHLSRITSAGLYWSSRDAGRITWAGPAPQNSDAIRRSIARAATFDGTYAFPMFVMKADVDGAEMFTMTFFRRHPDGSSFAIGLTADHRAHAETYMIPVIQRVARFRLADAADDVVAWRVISPGGDTILSVGDIAPGAVDYNVRFYRPRLLPDSATRNASFVAPPDYSDVRGRAPRGTARPDPRTSPYSISVLVDPQGMAAVLYGAGLTPPVTVAALLALSLVLTLATLILARRVVRHAREREAFATTVAHELRTPLTQILLHAETIQLDRAAVQTRQDAARVVVRETRRLIHLVENALRFVRGRRSTVRLDMQPSNLSMAVAESLDAHAPMADRVLAHIDRRLDPDVVARVDPNALHQIVVNLLDNALRFGPPGQTIGVRVWLADSKPRLSIEDEGPGVPEQDRERVFEPFTGDPVRGGNGIGLAVVRQLIELHDGRVWIEDGVAGGARFVVEFSAEQSAPAVTTTSPAARTSE